MHNLEDTTSKVLNFFTTIEEEESSCLLERVYPSSLTEFDNAEYEENSVSNESGKEIYEDIVKENVIDEIILAKEQEILKKAEKVLEDANNQAEEILKQAKMKAIEIQKEAFSQGQNEGYYDGSNKAYEENKLRLEEGTMKFLLHLKDLTESYAKEKNKLISQNIDEMRDLSIAIAEKVIQVSLKSSGDIVKRMIISATEKMRYKEWAKIYIARSEASMIIEGSTDLLRTLSHLSEYVKFVVMEDAPAGTCIIELPDQVIDVSTGTQIENIKGVLRNISPDGGHDNV